MPLVPVLDPLRDLIETLDCNFVDETLLREALTHSSLLNEPPGKGLRDNRRLAWVGDAVVDVAVTEWLCSNRPGADQEVLDKERQNWVRDEALAAAAKAESLNLGARLLISPGTSREAPAVLAQAFEAVIGAVFLHRNYEAAARLVHRFVEPHEAP